MDMLVQLQSSHFLYKIHSYALLLGEVVLGGNGNLYTEKLFRDQSFITIGNDMELLMKFHTINHSNYHHLVPLTKLAVKVRMEHI